MGGGWLGSVDGYEAWQVEKGESKNRNIKKKEKRQEKSFHSSKEDMKGKKVKAKHQQSLNTYFYPFNEFNIQLKK